MWYSAVGCIVLFILSLLVAPLTVEAQQPEKVPRIGFLGLAPASAWASQVEALRTGLRDLGYVEGQTMVIEFRWAAKVDQMPELRPELVRLPVDVIVAPASTQVNPPARQRPRSLSCSPNMPTRFVSGTWRAWRARRNITGVSMALTDIAAKELEILKEAVPHVTRIGVLWNPTTPSNPYVLKAVEAAGRSLRVEPDGPRTVEDFEGVFAMLARERAEVFSSVGRRSRNSQRAPLAALALQHRLPGIFMNKANVEAGGLMSYGSDFNYMYRRTASLREQNPQRRAACRPARGAVDEIRAGAQPRDGTGARDHVPPDDPLQAERGDRVDVRGTPESGAQDARTLPNNRVQPTACQRPPRSRFRQQVSASVRRHIGEAMAP